MGFSSAETVFSYTELLLLAATFDTEPTELLALILAVSVVLILLPTLALTAVTVGRGAGEAVVDELRITEILLALLSELLSELQSELLSELEDDVLEDLQDKRIG